LFERNVESRAFEEMILGASDNNLPCLQAVVASDRIQERGFRAEWFLRAFWQLES
jgi:hypothetical protein